MCTKKNLTAGLQITSRIIGTGNTLPILNNILFKTDKGRLKLSATNLEMAVKTWVGGKLEEEGELTVPAKLINDYINNLETEKVSISTKGETMTLEGERAQTHIKGLGGEDFPLIPEVDGGGGKAIAKAEAAELQGALGEVVFAAAYSETQPEISGVQFSFEGSTLTVAATDRYRLAQGKVKLAEAVGTTRQVIVPARVATELGRILNNDVVEIYLSEGQISFKTVDTELVSRLIEGQYPDYKQIIPQNFATQISVGRNVLTQALKAASLFATDGNNVELEFSPQGKQVVIRSQSAQTGDSEIRVEGEFEGQKNSVIFNYRYLLECLSHLTDERVTLKVIGGGSPAEIVPIGRDNYLYIVMPIKL